MARLANGFRAGQVFGKGGSAQRVLSKSLSGIGNIFQKGSSVGLQALDIANKTGLINEASQIPDIGPAIAQGAAAAPSILNTAGTVGGLLSDAGNALN
jgi:hypothetical protein